MFYVHSSFFKINSDQNLLPYQSVVSNDDLNIFTRRQVIQCFDGWYHLGNCQR